MPSLKSGMKRDPKWKPTGFQRYIPLKTRMGWSSKGGVVSGWMSQQRYKAQKTCPHCGKIGSGFAMVRWHFKNCRAIVASQRDGRQSSPQDKDDQSL